MRLMYWPNEPDTDNPKRQQVGARNAFSALEPQGVIESLSVYSYLVERKKSHSKLDFQAAAIEEIRRFGPDILFVQHVGGSDLDHRFWSAVRTNFPKLAIVYHELDVYSRMIKRVDLAMDAVLRVADLVLVSGLGHISEMFGARSLGKLAHLPPCFDVWRFASLDPASARKTKDVVMIGNRGNLKKAKFLYMPGGRRRAQLASRLTQRHGKDFSLYGSGWDHLVSSRGRADFLEQEAIIQSARVSVNWDHFDHIPYYFSDRLPISLAAGVPHVTSYHKGYEHVLAGCPGLYTCASVSEVIDCVDWLLSKSDGELLQEGLAARDWAHRNLEASVVFRRAFDLSVKAHHARQHS